MFEKVKIKVDSCLCPIIKVDNEAIYHNMSYFSSVWTSLGPILVKLFVEHIICPQFCISRILEDLTEIYIIGLTITL